MVTSIVETRARSKSLTEILSLVQPDLEAVAVRMRETTIEQNDALRAGMEYLIGAGGKRLRPALTMLAAHLFEAPYDRSVSLAAAVEMLHTASLVHDDLIDGALLRRGRATLNAQWTAPATVLAGDFMFGRAAELAAQAQSLPVMNSFARTLMTIVNGELNQMFNGRGHPTREGYFKRIFGKTGSLFVTAAEGTAFLAEMPAYVAEAMAVYGREVGIAFQIIDDILDFTGEEARVGKPVGSDLRQGLFTLPALIYLDQRPDDANIAALLNGHAGDGAIVERVVHDVRASGAIDLARSEARAYVRRAQAALSVAPDNLWRQALHDLAESSLDREI